MESKIQMSFMRISIISMLVVVLFKLVCIDDQFSKPFKSGLGQNALHRFIINMVKESNEKAFS